MNSQEKGSQSGPTLFWIRRSFLSGPSSHNTGAPSPKESLFILLTVIMTFLATLKIIDPSSVDIKDKQLQELFDPNNPYLGNAIRNAYTYMTLYQEPFKVYEKKMKEILNKAGIAEEAQELLFKKIQEELQKQHPELFK